MPKRWRTARWWVTIPAVSTLLIVPCLWQSRIQSADLASHLYNAWLANLIQQGRAPGLYLVPQWSNTLFDRILAWLLPLVGVPAAERVAVSLAVLVLAWGAFALLCAASRGRPWFLMPCVAMLAYGWVFHMGFFNYYLSLGICLVAVALCWKPSVWRGLAAVPLLILASVAHAVPVVWAVAALAYIAIARRIRPRYRPVLTGLAIVGLGAITLYLRAHYEVQWSPSQNFAISGLDQLVVFEAKYFAIAAGVLGWWTLLFLGLLDQRGARRTLLAVPLHLAVCVSAGAFLIPGRILLPGESQALSFIAHRWSLVVGLSICAALGMARPQPWMKGAIVALAGVFFAMIYADSRSLNREEDRMEAALDGLPAGARVVAAPISSGGRIDPYVHMIDRACIGRCFSYANYEAPSAAFRIRARSSNRLVTADYRDSCAMQTGRYRVRAGDLPLAQVALCAGGAGKFCISELAAGDTSGDQILGRTSNSRLRFQTSTAAYR